ncbi:uncharacterized protein LOC132704443 [Cylas formicarius]|uniref:uncharacterized protein LOC132704443 n=1 Tax=Cylas formicarius TaxID=197179 RepID=UPI002958B90F|nr:uncharacterized protein LOC132704443 [Cylas formicarius]XP_060530426.1 uncharacterized protein LOC132704443 [Cylas formicarius]
MDPVGPWYASYNRLAAQAAAGEHHPLAAAAAAAAAASSTTTAGSAGAASAAAPTTAVLPGGFLSPPPVGYETVFSPLFHAAGAVAAGGAKSHYVTQVTQHRALAAQAAAAKQSAEGNEFHPQAQAFFEQGAPAWQQNSPFGILPHESVVATTTSKGVAYENFNAHFAVAQQSINNHINSQLVANSKAANINRAQSPQVSTATIKVNSSQGNSSTFFQVPVTLSENNNAKPFTSTNTSNLQQSCIVSSPSTTKEYRIPQAPNRAFISSPNPPSRTIEKSFTSPPSKPQSTPQIQTKAQTKIYSELGSQREQQQQQQRSNEDNQSQSSPISFSIMDAPGRLNYSGSNASGKRPPHFQHNYRHYQQQQPPNSNSEDFQRPKSGPEYPNSSNGADCNVVVPRRPSPLQAHSQASPLGHAQSPAYPMYNSPMNSMSSPQQNSSNQQVAPPSPLDVSVPRPNSQTGGNVAYPSVITRALNTDKNFERYEHTNQSNPPSNQACWDERQNQQQQQQQQRKFQGSQPNSQSNNYNNNSSIELAQRQPEGQRQQYFDSNSGHQVTLQDLSSCRGDPMSIVKNLQQQQTCQVQQPEIKQEIVKPPVKRRKSVEKAAPPPPDVHVTNRVPPPAHSSGANQQQQNGVYFDFDRWNLPPPSSKIFSTQAALHQQHQGLMVPHPHGHHPPPPLPYFAPFHIANHPSEFSSTVELTPLTNYNEQQPPQQPPHQPQHPPPQPYQQPDDQPKVVVPNIEEELNFLSGDTTPRSAITMNHQHPKQASVPPKPLDKPCGPGAGFMSSYLKFLQGERDTSPPPSMRGGGAGARKQTTTAWTRKPTEETGVKPPPQPGGVSGPPDTNGVAGGVPLPTTTLPHLTGPPPGLVTRLTTSGDPQDDPRYFPLPKERKRDTFDSSDDGFSSEDDFFGGRKQIPKSAEPTKERDKPLQMPLSKQQKHGRSSKPGGATERKRAKVTDKDKTREFREKNKRDKNKDKAKQVENVPKREQTKRAVKGKNNLSDIIKDDNEPEEPPEFQDSEDSDPAWTPAASNTEEDGIPVKKKGRGRQGGTKTKKGMKNLIAAAAQGAGINDSDGYPSEQPKKKPSHKNKQIVPTLEDNIAASMQNSFVANDDNPFKPGEFVVIKSDLGQEWPPIWRVDGKTLLQKYEPFEQNGVTLYRNISTYTSWTPESKKQYVSVPVKYKSQTQLETIVVFLKEEMTIIDPKFQEQCMKQCESYQDNFEVYIQTLISQALDSNFLMEIFQEKDEYFLTNVQTIDEITDIKKQKLLSLLKWPTSLQMAVCTWPCFNIIREIGQVDASTKICAGCAKNSVAVRVLMYGQPYNATTLEGCQPDPNAINEKDFFMCRICASRVELSSKVIHQKYLMYIECAKRVSEKRSSDQTKDTTCILNELLADENWLNQLFLEVRTLWSEIDCIEHSYKMKNVYAQ